MKKLARNAVVSVLGYQVRRLTKKNDIKIIGVVGSIGKTSTKLAVASVLSSKLSVQYQEGNYNDLVSVPLIFFGEELPALYNPFAWIGIFLRNQRQLRQHYPFEVVVVELGSDGPGQISEFKRYLNLEIGIVTAISPEHMQFFGTLDNVAKEELMVGSFSSLVLANKDLCTKKYLKDLPNLLTYSIQSDSDFSVESLGLELPGISNSEKYSRLAAAAVASKLGLDKGQIKAGIKKIKPAAGRMQQLKGVNNSTIIDDTYNSSPEAVKMALDYIYELKAPQKIAVLGNMNELGDYSKQAHEEIGSYCDPKQLRQVVTIGPDANEYLAKAAEDKGCSVKRFDSPYEAGDYLKTLIEHGALVLVKGSQNKVFAEETVKTLLANPDDASNLVRQGPQWLKIKRKAFNK